MHMGEPRHGFRAIHAARLALGALGGKRLKGWVVEEYYFVPVQEEYYLLNHTHALVEPIHPHG